MGGVRFLWVGCKHHSSHLFINYSLRSILYILSFCKLCVFLFQMADLVMAFMESTERCRENAWLGN